jgi:hypothetical protein
MLITRIFDTCCDQRLALSRTFLGILELIRWQQWAVALAHGGMTSTLETAAKTLLSDPPWMRVFKNTYDAIEEQLNKVLIYHYV